MNARPKTSELIAHAMGKADPPGVEAGRADSASRLDCFPTSIWRFTLPDHETLNRNLLRLAQDERRRDPAGIGHRSSVLGWHSTDRLHRRPEMAEFLALLQDNVAEVGRAYRIDTKQVSLELATCWIIINGKFACGAVHCHPNAFLSGAYYITAAENCGDIFFQDPRHAALMGACPVTEHAPWTVRQISYRPSPGSMLIFPSWLYHGVEPNLSEAPRVSLSFNFRLNWKARS
jgi:uncharacterized protein (TIGR02466 family)